MGRAFSASYSVSEAALIGASRTATRTECFKTAKNQRGFPPANGEAGDKNHPHEDMRCVISGFRVESENLGFAAHDYRAQVGR